ncbi:hypothetical protein EYC80_002134 [Monilinia laxa]|uniref:Initiation-specific alpha-1,6-mannosyltransferase n=1 Tax=Monilinia laxa TaxID=61186 RepID=A0A5N6K3C2_MONLA|nr:hypothetical protein EYC80_002134 [Monilinia laxa]
MTSRSHIFFSIVVIFLLIVIAIQYDELNNQGPISIDSLNSSMNTHETLATHKSIPTLFPKKLWYKAGPQGVSEEAKRFRNHCLNISPGYKSEILTDAFADEYIWKWFSHRPDILNTYFSLSVPILRADLLRYLILYAYGGVWFDLDVSCEDVPIQKWVLDEHRDAANLVVGLEFDCAWQDDGYLYSQFASWTIMAKPGSPHLMQVIDDILAEFSEIAQRNNVTIDGIQLSMINDVVDSTGPKRMTLGIVKSLNRILGRELDDRDVGELRSARLIHDVLILPANAFAGIQNGFAKDKGSVLVNHHYAGTWKNKFGGEGEKGSEQEKEIEHEKQIEYEREIEKQKESENEKESEFEQEKVSDHARTTEIEQENGEKSKDTDQKKTVSVSKYRG